MSSASEESPICAFLPRIRGARRPYVFVESIDETLHDVVAHGGEIVTPPYPEGDLRVATFRDVSGNVVGVWQQA